MNIPTSHEAYSTSLMNRKVYQEDNIAIAITTATAKGHTYCEYWSNFDPTEVVEKLKELGYTVEVEKWKSWHGTIHKHHHSLLVIYWSHK